MSFIGAIIAITCMISGNIGGAILAVAIGVAIDAIVIDVIGLIAILETRKEVKSEDKKYRRRAKK